MTTAVDTPATIAAKIDAVAEKVDAIGDEIEFLRRRRVARDESRNTMLPVTAEAFAVAARELEALGAEGKTDELLGLVKQFIESAGSLEKALAALETVTSIVGEAAPLSGEAVAALTHRLAALDDRGYFAFARHAASVLDRVVTSFDPEDVDALGDNIVLMLETIKEMTQPQVMHMLRRTAAAVQLQQRDIEGGEDDTPSLWQLLRSLRDPDVRRGLARALNTLRSVAAEAPETGEPSRKGDG